ncbi:hypothetical protein BCR36DRAFT_179105 [Piromyces finnis]|uniref:Transmembrane protein n=1 Tax=Piromyces finnis TaxID=1754191 RepID=A0A1Y1UUG2_9FUNG|nr:hypothetical protein BCR36DRAFT_179105 [Piromyces finnis]|eukprot:ORX41646.1 hypothetical protein BCR36DRAFT_179105 [Piromyces finnis]
MSIQTKGGQKILSSLPFEILLYFNRLYYYLFLLGTLVLLIYKGIQYPFPNGALYLELLGLIPFTILESIRIYLGSQGNKTEERLPTGVSLGLSFISVFGYIYYMIWQTYVLLFDIILSAIGLVFIIGDIIFAIILFINLTNASV